MAFWGKGLFWSERKQMDLGRLGLDSVHDARDQEYDRAQTYQKDGYQRPNPQQQVGAFVLWRWRSDPQDGMPHPHELQKEFHDCGRLFVSFLLV
jgi:hypothetical protein